MLKLHPNRIGIVGADVGDERGCSCAGRMGPHYVIELRAKTSSEAGGSPSPGSAAVSDESPWLETKPPKGIELTVLAEQILREWQDDVE